MYNEYMNIFIHIHNSNVKYYLKASQFQIRSNLKKKKTKKKQTIFTFTILFIRTNRLAVIRPNKSQN